MKQPLVNADPTRPEPSMLHPLEYQQCVAYVQQKTGLGTSKEMRAGDRMRVLEDLARALLLRVRSAGELNVVGEAREQAFETHFSAALLEKLDRDEVACWLVTDALVCRILRSRNPDQARRDQKTEFGDKLQEAHCRALDELKGGRYPIQKYLEAQAKLKPGEETSFWRYYCVAVKSKTTSWFGKKWFSRSLWEKTDSIDVPASDDDFRRPEPRDPGRVAERALVSAHRLAQRRQTMEQVRLIAMEGASPGPGKGKSGEGDPNCKIMVQFIDWLQAHPELEALESPQAAFIEESGLPSGTVNSALSRFRKKYGFDQRTSAWRNAFLYTTHGGSSS